MKSGDIGQQGTKAVGVNERRKRRARPSPARLKQALSTAMELGLTIGSIEITDDCSVRIIIGSKGGQDAPKSEFDLWEGKL